MPQKLASVLSVLVFCACSQTFEVLGPAPSSRSASNAGHGAQDAGRTQDASTTFDAGSRASTGDGNAPCELCAADQLCSIDSCVPARGPMSIASWLSHSCEVESGRLFCWGSNENGQLGVGDQAARSVRTRVGSFNDWLSVAVGEQHTCALRVPGRLYCWGKNDSGQLGLGDTVARADPTSSAAGARWQKLACGGDNCCALSADGALSCWGDNLEGKLGQGDPYGAPDSLVPIEVAGHMQFREVGVGQGHVCAIRDDGELYCWGRNTTLELGIGNADPIQLRVPTRVGNDSDWLALAASQHHSCAIRAAGSMFCWGGNPFLEVGAPASVTMAMQPTRVGNDNDWLSVAVGWFHSCGVRSDGRLFCWGRAIEGQLGQNSVDPIGTATLVTPPERWQRIALGNFFTLGIDEAGDLYSWGENKAGTLGLGDDTRRFAPTKAP